MREIVSPLGGFRSPFGSLRSGASWSPALLFTAGEQGYWLDPSDFTTMFQNAAGTTPVTATGQRVRLMLDKSKGLALGAEALTSAWTDLGSTGTVISTGSDNVQFASAVNGQFALSNPEMIRGWHQFVITVDSISSGEIRINDGGAEVRTGITTPGTYSVIRNFTSGPRLRAIGTSTTATITGISARKLAGNHFTQANVANAPLLQQDASGRYFLLFDGSDDWLQSAATINPGAVDKVQVFAGVRKLSDAAVGSLLAASADPTTNNGSLGILAPETAAANTYRFSSRGTALATATGSGFAAPVTSVVTGLGDISGDTAILRVNGTQAASSTADQGTGNFLTYTHFIGRRGGTTNPLNGRLYQLITRYGANLTAAQIAATETFVNQRTGAY